MRCGSCEKKCGNVHCPVSYTLIEAANTCKPFRRLDSDVALILNDDGFFRYLTVYNTCIVYNPNRDDYLAEYTLEI